MRKEYKQTKEQSTQFAWEAFLAQAKIRTKVIRYLKPLSVLGASLYCLTAPAESTSNEAHSPTLSILLTLIVQLPLCSLILYLILKLAVYAPLRAIRKEIEKIPDAHWGPEHS